MHIAGAHGFDLSYCSNVHPAETAQEVLAVLAGPVAQVRAHMDVAEFGVGLRVSGQAAAQFRDPALRQQLKATLAAHHLYVFSLNGFPHGRFHGTAVKRQVYRPDWREAGRLNYTRDLVDLLQDIAPRRDDLLPSISTVPGGFRADLGPDAPAVMASHLIALACELWALREAGGPTVVVALEPEPGCLLETVADAVEFFGQHLYGADAVAEFARACRVDAADAEQALHRHLGLCFDACHGAVEFEDPAACVDQLIAAGIPIAKVQVSAGLELEPTAEALHALGRFADEVYLHQVVARTSAGLVRYDDVPEALAAHRAGLATDADRWRVHYHVPVFRHELGPFASTQPFLSEVLGVLATRGQCRQFEVETYTWDVLPPEHRQAPVDQAIARELGWTLQRLQP